MKIEIAVQDFSGARIAYSNRADRIELCMGLPLGGLTPSFGLTKRVYEGLPNIKTQALIRPRPGDFIYHHNEVKTMAEDIKALAPYVEGFVIGALTPENTIDADSLRQLMHGFVGKKDFTFHRAFDVIEDKKAALKELENLGFTRVLTSGGFNSAYDGREVLTELAAEGSGVEIMAGGGLQVENLPAFQDTGVEAVHLSCKSIKTSEAVASNVSLGSADDGETGYEITDEDAVWNAVACVHSF